MINKFDEKRTNGGEGKMMRDFISMIKTEKPSSKKPSLTVAANKEDNQV